MFQGIERLQNARNRFDKCIRVTGLFVEVDKGVLSHAADEFLD